jgi:TonB family protein
MRARRLCSLIHVASLMALLCSIALSAASPQELRYVIINEETLRRYAVEVVMPSYPQRARRRNAQGVAVVQLDVNEQGGVAGADVLEAPDPLIREAVVQAVRQWKFKPPTIHGKAVSIRGKLTFYYVIKNGEGRVENPRQFK